MFNNILLEFEEILKYKFNNKSLLKNALEHPSFNIKSNFQNLEFLGDRVLGLIICEFLILNNKNFDIKKLANNFTHLVNQNCILKIAKNLTVEKYLKHEIQNVSNKVMVDTVEAIIGAVFLDSNYETCVKIINKLWENEFEIAKNMFEPKMLLQEIAQSYKSIPKYEMVEMSGSMHEPTYIMKVSVPNLGEALGVGNSKQSASKEAAMSLLKKIEKC